MRRRAATLPNVTFHGFLPKHLIGGYLERARLLVSTSETEGFPNTFLQAWSRGTPVVTFIDPQQLIGRHRLGILVNDADALGTAIAKLAGEPEQWRAASARSCRYMDAHADEQQIVGAYTQALSGLLRPSAASGARRLDGAA